ncbi:MAG: hypothetical protein FWG66_01765 [Spirochaetes bacterium]|nr:hypothetical protein [Spirochaetota bacterium]
MKKTARLFRIVALVAALATIGTVAAYAQVPLSFGISTSLISDFGGGVSGRVTEANGFNSHRLGNELYMHESYTGRASSIFFDAHFVQFSLSYFTSTGTATVNGGSGNYYTGFGGGIWSIDGSSPSGIEFGLLGKFPVELSPAVTVFPLGGIVYRLVLGGNIGLPIYSHLADPEISANPFHMSALWFRLGGGMDFALTQGIFLRGTVTYGIRLRNRLESNIIDTAPIEVGGTVGVSSWLVDYDSTRLGHGVDITVGVGFRLR